MDGVLDQVENTAIRPGPGGAYAAFDFPHRREAVFQVSCLLILSDPVLRSVLEDALGDRSVGATIVAGSQVQNALTRQAFDVILLDAALEDVDALDLCRELAGLTDTSVILMTRRDDTSERTAIEIGAHDAVWRGSPREIAARARAARRREDKTRPAGAGGSLLFSGWALDIGTRKLISPTGAMGWLKDCDARLLIAILENAGRCLSRKAVAALMDDRGERDPYAVDWGVRFYRLRKALAAIEPSSNLIQNVRSRGYVIEGDVVRGPPLRRR